MKCAASLLEIDAHYLWHRMPVAALEDVGFGNPVGVAMVMAASHSFKFRHRIGAKQCLFACVAALCESTKSRSLCDALLLTQNRPPMAKDWKAYVDRLPMPWLVKFLAGRGNTFAGLGTVVPNVYRMIETAEVSVIDTLPDPWGDEVINSLSACALDQYTSEGKRSFAYFRQSCTDARRYYDQRPHLDPVKTLGSVVFFVEGKVARIEGENVLPLRLCTPGVLPLLLPRPASRRDEHECCLYALGLWRCCRFVFVVVVRLSFGVLVAAELPE